MSEPRTAIRFSDVGKMYKVFANRGDNLVDALGLTRLMPWRAGRFREFWALRSIDFELKQGQRLGVIGRNGAGKSTLLKLVTGNLAPTEGEVYVDGNVQALLEIGGGLHPEFTGRENIQAALVHLGLSAHEIDEAADEIADFTELGSFLEQPFKTYSLGMQARLSFAIGTVVKPEILIIDEILGAGDAYFFGKSTARMHELIERGASVLLVSHGLDQVIRFCDETIWLDRGQIAMRGPSVEVVKAYEKFVRELEDRRLVAKNRKSRIARFDAFEREGYTDYLTARVTASAGLDVAEVALLVNGEREDEVAVGAAQDADPGQSAAIALAGDAWSSPEREGDRYYRKVSPGLPADTVFNLWFFYPDADYAFDVTYRAADGGSIALARSGRFEPAVELPVATDWTTLRVDFCESDESWSWQGGGRGNAEEPALHGRETPSADTRNRRSARDGIRVSRWPGEGSITIDDVVLLDADGSEQAIFQPHSQLALLLRAKAHEPGTFRVQPVAAIYRMDGILVSNFVGNAVELDLEAGDPLEFRLTIDDVNLGDGRYVTSVALYRELAVTGISVSYDLIDRSYEFEIVGSHPFDNGVFRHPGSWVVRLPASDRVSSR